MKKINYREYIEQNTTKCDVSYRGGVLKVDISRMLTDTSNERIQEAGEEAIAGASQNYLGGGIAGRITTGRSFDINLLTKGDQKKYEEFCTAVIEYFHFINNGGGDEYMQENHASLEFNQNLPVSGY